MSALPDTRSVIVVRARTGALNLDLHSVWQYRELLYFLVWRDVKVRYAQAALGTGWAIVQPLIAVAIFTVIFHLFAKLPSDGLPYPVFAMAAVLPWTYFSEAARRSAFGLVGDADLVKKVYFPRLIIPLANIVSPLIDFAITLMVLIALMAWYGIALSPNVVFLPIFVVMTMALSLSIGLWLGPINVRFRDVMHTLPFVLQIWMYATPIVYPFSMVPDRWKTLYALNPTVGLIEGFRWALLGHGTLDVKALMISAGVITAALFFGLVWFRRAERSFADII
jgi:lipopolysaccharide transport system permease protein